MSDTKTCLNCKFCVKYCKYYVTIVSSSDGKIIDKKEELTTRQDLHACQLQDAEDCLEDLTDFTIGPNHYMGIDETDIPCCDFSPIEEDDGAHVPKLTNQGREFCYKCNTKTVKVSSGMYNIYDVCPNCKI